MLGNTPFNFNTTEKIVAAFGWIFSDIHVIRPNARIIKVPIEFSGKEKWYQREISDPNAGDVATQRHIDQIWPRMAFDLTNFHYDPSRKLSTISYRVNSSAGLGGTALKQLNPVPMIFDFTLFIRSRTLEDGWSIIEQFIPFFTPDLTVPILDIPGMNIKTDILFTLKGNSSKDNYDGALLKNRELIWEFNFEAQGHMYPPINTKKIITAADISLFTSQQSNPGAIDTVATINPSTANITDAVTVDTEILET